MQMSRQCSLRCNDGIVFCPMDSFVSSLNWWATDFWVAGVDFYGSAPTGNGLISVLKLGLQRIRHLRIHRLFVVLSCVLLSQLRSLYSSVVSCVYSQSGSASSIVFVGTLQYVVVSASKFLNWCTRNVNSAQCSELKCAVSASLNWCTHSVISAQSSESEVQSNKASTGVHTL